MMKKTIQVLTLVAVLLLCSNLYSQKSVKLGHFSSTELIKKMPEGDSAQATMQKYMAELQTEAETIQKEYDRLVGEYQAKEAQLSDQQIEFLFACFVSKFQKSAQEDIQKKQGELMLAITDKIKAAVAEVAKENKYTYILESTGILWYAEESEDITPLLIKKLNVK